MSATPYRHLPTDTQAHIALAGQRLHTSGASTSPTGALGMGDVRLLQSYLRALGYYGNPETVRGIDVVNGHMDRGTVNAITHFVADHGAAYGVAGTAANHRLLGAVRTYYTGWMAGTSASAADEANLIALDQAFARTGHYPSASALARLHPAMRFPLETALNELQHRGIPMRLVEGYRPPENQETEVRTNASTAPPGWSLHGYGLAVDLAPANCTRNCSDPHSATWRTIISVMQKYGFSSLYAEQGWDLGHFELPVRTAHLVHWPHDNAGHRIIPPSAMPAAWIRINNHVLGH